MIELNIGKNESDQRLNKFIMKYLDRAPSSFVYKMLRKKNITLNNKKASGNEILSEGDIVKLFLANDTISNFKSQKVLENKDISLDNKHSSVDTSKLIVLYKNDDIMAVHKPAGLLSQKAKNDDISINEIVVAYCDQHKLTDMSLGYKPSIANRLDRNTSGIILAGISLKGSQYLAKILKDRKGDKYYFTIVRGLFKQTVHSKAYISKDNKNNVSKVISTNEFNSLPQRAKEDFNYIETIFEPISNNSSYTLLRVKLITGKSHQIRAHLFNLGYPVIGDSKYGDMEINRYFRDKYKLKHHLLHSGMFIINDLIIKDELPDIFLKICNGEHIDMKHIF